MAKTAFIGLGVMGYPMAGFLAKAGHDVTVYNRTSAKAKAWLEEYQPQARGALKTAPTPAAAAEGNDFIFACVTRDQDVEEITAAADGAFQGMHKGAIFVDHTSASADVERRLGLIAESDGFGYLDAPVSGGQAGAVAGRLTVMCGGKPEIFAKAEPIMQAYAISVKLLGEYGSGQLCKMVNQICLVGAVQGVAEGLAFGEKAGLDMATVLEVVSKGSASSWQLENSGGKMLKGEFNFGFAVDLVRKDLLNCLNEARQIGAALPATALIDQFLADLQRIGANRQDVTSLMRRLK